MEKYTIDELLASYNGRGIVPHISALVISLCQARYMLLTARRSEMQKRSYTDADIIRPETV